MVKTFETVLSEIDKKMETLTLNGVTPRVIILGKVNFYTFVGTPNLEAHKDVDVNTALMNSNTTTSEFYYKKLPIFFSNTLKLPGDGEWINVYGD